MDETTTKETDCMNSHTMPVLPLVANGHGHHDRGLEGKDAVLIHSNQTSLNSNLLQDSFNRNSKENVIETLNAKFDNERSAREMEMRLTTLIKDEAVQTRTDLFRDEVRRLERERNDARFAALEKLIEKMSESSGS